MFIIQFRLKSYFLQKEHLKLRKFSRYFVNAKEQNKNRAIWQIAFIKLDYFNTKNQTHDESF